MHFRNTNFMIVRKSFSGTTFAKAAFGNELFFRTAISSATGTCIVYKNPATGVAEWTRNFSRKFRPGTSLQHQNDALKVASNNRVLHQDSEPCEKKRRCRIAASSLHTGNRIPWPSFRIWSASSETEKHRIISGYKALFHSFASSNVGGTDVQCRCYSSSVASGTTVLHQTSEPRSFKEVPGPRGLQGLPIVGLLFQLQPFSKFSPGNFVKIQDHWYKKYGPLVKVRMGTMWVCQVYDPKDIETIYRADGRYPRRMPFLLSEAYYRKSKLPPGIVVLNGEGWREQRRAVQSVIQRPSVVRQYVPLISNLTDELVDKLRNKSEVSDVFGRLVPFTVEAICLLLFNKRLGCLDESNAHGKEILYYSEMLLDAFSRQYEKPAWFFNFRSKLYDDYEKSYEYLRNIAHECLTVAFEKMKSLEETGAEMETNATMLLLKESNLPLEKLKTTLLELFSGGIDAIAGQTTYVLYHLAKHQDKQEKVFQEVKDFTGKTLTAGDLQNVPYLKACVKESFRLVFPVPGGPTRILDKDVTLSGYNIPKNTPLQICSGTACRDEKYFSDPERFLPERWLREARGEREDPFVFIPFGHGPRNCIGQRFAEVEIHLLVAKLIQTFKFTLPEGVTEAPAVYTTFAKPATPLTLLIQAR